METKVRPTASEEMTGSAVLRWLGPESKTRRKLHRFYTEFSATFFEHDEAAEERKKAFCRLYWQMLTFSGRDSLSVVADLRRFSEEHIPSIADGRDLWDVGTEEDEQNILELAKELWDEPGEAILPKLLQSIPSVSALAPRKRSGKLTFSRFMK